MLVGPSASEQSSETSCYTRFEILMGCLLKKEFGDHHISLKQKATEDKNNV